MSYTKPLFLFIFIAFLASPVVAKADIFVWQNQDKDVSLSFPDRWALVSHIADDEVLRIAAPAVTGRTENAQCRLRVRDDNRFKMHPVTHSDEIQRLYYGIEFWDRYVSEFKHAHINRFENNAGLGRGFASFADILYESHEHPKMIRRAIAFVSMYKNQVHIFECSAEESSYYKWYPSFMGILKSVDFKPDIPQKQGFYRNFYGGETIIHGRREIDDYSF